MNAHENSEINRILKSTNLYEILGLPENFEAEELKNKYRKVSSKAGHEVSSR